MCDPIFKQRLLMLKSTLSDLPLENAVHRSRSELRLSSSEPRTSDEWTAASINVPARWLKPISTAWLGSKCIVRVVVPTCPHELKEGKISHGGSTKSRRIDFSCHRATNLFGTHSRFIVCRDVNWTSSASCSRRGFTDQLGFPPSDYKSAGFWLDLQKD